MKRAGDSKPLQFGQCKTPQAVLKYARLEGFPIANVRCASCGYKWNMIITPRCDTSGFKRGRLVSEQPCAECSRKSVILSKLTRY